MSGAGHRLRPLGQQWGIRATSHCRLRGVFSANHIARNAVGVHCSQNGFYGPSRMKTLSAKDAKNRFGYLIDTARREPVSIEKHGRAVVVVLSVETYETLESGRPEAHRR